ncbi:MAG: hypothetical protein P8175_04210 [Deltaproteobacteria bacterium]
MPAATPDQSPDALTAAQGIISSLLLAAKMFSLYSDEHAHCRSALTRLHEHIQGFLRERGDLVFQADKNRLLFANKTVYKGSGQEGDIAYALFRDGVLELIFSKGLEPEETKAFITILVHYKTLPAEAEGDIVTALWEAELPHIRYEAADSILETDVQAEDQSKENFAPEQAQAKSASMPLEMHMVAESILETAQGLEELPKLDPGAVQLTAEEALKLEELVRKEEERDATHEILDMMADILRSQEDETFFGVILDYLEEELLDAFSKGDFETSRRIQKRLHQIRQLCEGSRPWARSLMEGFLERVSKADFLEPVGELWADIHESQLKMAGETLFMLSPKAVGPLGFMLLKAPSKSVQRMLSKVIIGLAARDSKPLERLLEQGDEHLVCSIIPLLGYMKDNRSGGILLKMAKDPSERIRGVSLKTVISRKLWAPERLMPLIDDENSGVRGLFLGYLGSRKSEAAETQLLIYLREAKSRKGNHDHLVDCFKALGRCGSSKSVPFLRDTLLGGSWFTRFFPSPVREGAAAALVELDTEESMQVLDAGSRSPYPGIRRAVQTAVPAQNPSGEMP